MIRICLMLAAIVVPAWTPLAAHTSPNTEIRLEPSSDALVARITVPVSDYASATGNPIGDEPATLKLAAQEVAQRISISSPGGSEWSISVDSAAFTTATGPADLNATITARPAPGASTEAVSLRWDMFPANAPGHIAMVMMDEDEMAAEDAIQGALTSRSKTLVIDLGRAVSSIPAPSETPIEEAGAPATSSIPLLLAGLVIAALFALAVLAAAVRLRRRPSSTIQTSFSAED